MILLPVLYIASFGPLCWISSRLDAGSKAVSVIFRPMLAGSSNDFTGRLEDGWIRWYANLGAGNGWEWKQWPDDNGRWRWTAADHGYL